VEWINELFTKIYDLSSTMIAQDNILGCFCW
jgi:hypothetical protein